MEAVVEALLFLQSEPVTIEQLSLWLETDPKTVSTALERLGQMLQQRKSGLTVQFVDGGVRLVTRPDLAEQISARLSLTVPQALSHASWEVLAIIAYRQPITRLEIEAIRQTGSDRALETLLARDLIEEAGRKESPGRPILYGTTHAFMRQFGLSSLDQLPPIKAVIKSQE